jgi:hypothetical protein
VRELEGARRDRVEDLEAADLRAGRVDRHLDLPARHLVAVPREVLTAAEDGVEALRERGHQLPAERALRFGEHQRRQRRAGGHHTGLLEELAASHQGSPRSRFWS